MCLHHTIYTCLHIIQYYHCICELNKIVMRVYPVYIGILKSYYIIYSIAIWLFWGGVKMGGDLE